MNEDDPYLESEEFKSLAAVWTGMMLASIFVMLMWVLAILMCEFVLFAAALCFGS